jgi:exosortase
MKVEEVFTKLNKNSLFLTAKILVLAGSTIALFSQDLAILFNDALQNETTSYMLLIPIIFAYLIYRKRKMLKAAVSVDNSNEPKETRHVPLLCGALLTLTAILLYWYGSYTFTPLENHMLTLPFFVGGLTLILFNAQTLRQLVFPIAFLAFLIPPPSEILYALGSALSTLSSEIPNAIINAFGIPSTINAEYINAPTIILTRPDGSSLEFTVDIACSGIYSLIGFMVFAIFTAYIIRDKKWKRLAIILFGIPLIYALNIIRITIILLLGYYYGETLALEIFHLTGSIILIFIGTILLLIIAEKLFKAKLFRSAKLECPKCEPNVKDNEFCLECGRILKSPSIKMKKFDIAKMAVVSLIIALLLSIQAPIFALTKATPIIVTNTPYGQQASTEILPKLPEYDLFFYYRDTEFEEKAKQDMSLVYIYLPRNETYEPVFVAIEIASKRSSLHRWETCLITWPMSKGYQPRVTQLELKDIKLNENPPILGRYFAFTYKDTNETQVVLYWYETTIFTINQTSQQKNVKLSLIAYPSPEDLPNVESQLTKIAKVIVNYWQQVKTWSQITMIISQNGATLAAISSAILMAIMLLYAFQVKRQREANTKAYSKLSKIHQQIIDAVKKTGGKTTPTLKNIKTTYEETVGNKISNTNLKKKLTELEKIGFVKRAMANINDEPLLIWKAQIK